MAIEVVFGATGPSHDRVRQMREVSLAPMPSDPLEESDGAGLVVEVRDAGGKLVYRRILHDSGKFIEGPGETSRTFVRVARKFRAPLHVIVPSVPGGRIVLLSSAEDGARATITVDARIPRIF